MFSASEFLPANICDTFVEWVQNHSLNLNTGHVLWSEVCFLPQLQLRCSEHVDGGWIMVESLFVCTSTNLSITSDLLNKIQQNFIHVHNH